MDSAESGSTSKHVPWKPRVLWESGHERVLYKLAGVASELTSDPAGRSLISHVQRECPEARLPHRLDRVSSGVLVVALTDEAIRHHNECIRAQTWHKLYVARIPTPIDDDDLLGERKAYLKRRRNRRGLDRMEVVRSGGQVSLLTVHALVDAPYRPGESHILVELQTGRYHQIRAMLTDLGSPLIGDDLYGGAEGRVYLEQVRLQFRPFGAEKDRVIFDRDAPEREELSSELLNRIANWETSTER